MNLLRVFPRQTRDTPSDNMAIIGSPRVLHGCWRGHVDEVHVSCVFTWDLDEANALAEQWQGFLGVPARVGGPGAGTNPGPCFTPGRYIRRGITFTSRGCPNNCPWCLVPSIEGKLRESSDPAPGYIIQDNNILACSRSHFAHVVRMLNAYPKPANFRGGLEAARLTDWHVAQLQRIKRLGEAWFAADSEAHLKPLSRAAAKLGWLGRRKKRCYVLVGYDDDTYAKAHARLERVWELGFLPFPQFYQPAGKETRWPQSREWRELIHNWSRKEIVFARHKAVGKEGK